MVAPFNVGGETIRNQRVVFTIKCRPGTNRASALVRQRSFSSIKTGISRVLECAAVRLVFPVSGEFHGILHGSLWGHGIVM